MLTTIGSPKEDMITLYNNFQYPDGELRSCQEFITLNPQTSDFSRYRSSTGPPFDGFLNGNDGGDKDCRFGRLSNAETGLHGFEEHNKASPFKQEARDTDLALFHKMKLMNTGVIDGFNGSSVSRQNSSPPTFLSNPPVNNGFTGSSKPSTSNINFSLGSMYMPRIPDSDDSSELAKRQYSSGFQSWDDDQRSYSLVDSPYSMNATHVSGLTHHLSLPVPMEKALPFGGSVPCKMRAKRGCATHPRSIAERVRRTRISERMRKLQVLFPDMDKNTSTADMLEMAVEHIKDLQTQVKTMSEIRARCTCSRTQKQ